MKKNNLFKAVGIVILAYILLSWIVPIVYSIGGFKGDVSNQIGFISIISVILETFTGFGAIILYVLLVGAFYGVLKATGAYDKLMDFLTEKATGKERLSLIFVLVSMVIISSITGLDLGLLVVFPLLIGFIVKLGYDKFVALSATAGATLVGMYGATYAGTLYGANNTVLSLEKNLMWPRLVLLVCGLAALIVFVLKYAKTNKLGGVKVKKEIKVSAKKSDTKKVSKTTKKSSKKSAVKTVKKEKKDKKERSGLPALIVMCNLLLVVALGTTAWGNIFKKNWFETAHSSWTGVTVGKFKILDKLFGGVDAFGSWLTPTRFQTYSLLLVIAMIAIIIIYRTKFEDAFEGFVDGLKSFVVPAILTILACSVFVFVYYNPFISVVTNALLTATKSFNLLTASLYTVINSFFYVDYYYLSYAVLYGIPQTFSDKAVLEVFSVMFVSLYSLVMLIAPTSVILLVSLSIADVKYTDWFKFIWKLVLSLLIASLAVLMIMNGTLVVGIIAAVIAVVLFLVLDFA